MIPRVLLNPSATAPRVTVRASSGHLAGAAKQPSLGCRVRLAPAWWRRRKGNAERIDLGRRHRLYRWVARRKSHEGRRIRGTNGHRTRNRRRCDRPRCLWLVRAIGIECDWFHYRVVCGSCDSDLAGPATEEGVTTYPSEYSFRRWKERVSSS